MHDKYITTLEFNKLTAENFAARLAQSNLVTKTDFDDKLINLFFYLFSIYLSLTNLFQLQLE